MLARRVALLVALVSCVPAAQAVVVGGGGSSRSDCLVVFDAAVNYPPDKPKRYRCRDGDPCDADATVNGVCAFDLTVCGNSTYNPLVCTLNGVATVTVDHAVDNGDKKFDPQFQALQSRINSRIVNPGDPPNTDPDVCTLSTQFLIPVVGPLPGNVCKRGKKQVKLTAYSVPVLGVPKKDRDKMTLECEPALAGCDAMAIFAGTYDRIQRQMFDKSCAVSGCHDSQTHQHDLVLEGSASYTELVSATPYTPAAADLGWLYVDPGSTATSYLYHKLTGDLPGGGLGARMPFAQAALDAYLVDIVRLWIEAGAPATGWVPGTF
jgi:hypothetical protein